MWDMLNTMQLIIFLPLLSLECPSFLVSFLSFFNVGAFAVDTDRQALSDKLSFYNLFATWNEKD